MSASVALNSFDYDDMPLLCAVLIEPSFCILILTVPNTRTFLRTSPGLYSRLHCLVAYGRQIFPSDWKFICSTSRCTLALANYQSRWLPSTMSEPSNFRFAYAWFIKVLNSWYVLLRSLRHKASELLIFSFALVAPGTYLTSLRSST